MSILNISFYRFVRIEDLPSLRIRFREHCEGLGLKGTILLSPEGINGFLAGTREKIRSFHEFLDSMPEFTGIEFKESWSEEVPFRYLLVKLKKEIITMGRPDLQPGDRSGVRLLPEELKRWLDEGKEFTLLDTRNDYEVQIGTFKGAIDFGIQNFRQFPEKLKSMREADRQRPVVMFCTGGIRCEKATALALEEGFEEVYQLEGGILKYFELCAGAHYRGDCFIFDERRAVDPDLRVPQTAEASTAEEVTVTA